MVNCDLNCYRQNGKVSIFGVVEIVELELYLVLSFELMKLF